MDNDEDKESQLSPVSLPRETVREEPKAEAIYEPPPKAKIKNTAAAATTTPSESDETAYGRTNSIYSRAPSQCSSVSATQSFDMRMYGKAMKMAGGSGGDGGEKLENPYYYYGSTRNQKSGKKAAAAAANQKPRPLLPSQRQGLEMRPPSRPPSRSQAAFQRSRSLGGYYAGRDLPPTPNDRPAGSMTPMSYSKWQHGDSGRKNPLYDTPPAARRPQLQEQALLAQYQHEQQQHHQLLMQREIRTVMGTPPTTARRHNLLVTRPTMPHLMPRPSDPLSPILTDQEMSPLHQQHDRVLADFLTSDDNLSSPASTTTSGSSRGAGGKKKEEESEVTQGYSEGLADNEFSEVESSSVFQPTSGANFVSPLEYSAMLKLYSNGGGASAAAAEPDLKDIWQKQPPEKEESFSSSDSEAVEAAAGNYQPLPKPTKKESPEFRWDGKPIEKHLSDAEESCLTEDGVEDPEDEDLDGLDDDDDDESAALADIETDYDEEVKGSSAGGLMARRHMEKLQQSMNQQKEVESLQQKSPL